MTLAGELAPGLCEAAVMNCSCHGRAKKADAETGRLWIYL